MAGVKALSGTFLFETESKSDVFKTKVAFLCSLYILLRYLIYILILSNLLKLDVTSSIFTNQNNIKISKCIKSGCCIDSSI